MVWVCAVLGLGVVEGEAVLFSLRVGGCCGLGGGCWAGCCGCDGVLGVDGR